MTCCAQSRCGVVAALRFRIWKSPWRFCSLAASSALGQDAPAASSFTITGVVKSGSTPIPGATVTATNSSSEARTTTSTDINGAYTLQVPAAGKYRLRVEMPAFAPATREIVLGEASSRADLELTLLSRTQQADASSNGRQPPEPVEDFRACQSCRDWPPPKAATAMERTRSCRPECPSPA